MKKIFISLLMAIVCLFGAACFTKKIDASTLANSFKPIANAKSVTHEIKEYAGKEENNVLLSQQTKTFTVNGSAVTLEIKSKTLNPDFADIFADEEAFIEVESSEQISLDVMKGQLPTEVALDGNSTTAENFRYVKDGNKITFDLVIEQAAVASVLAISEAEAANISNLTLQAVTVNNQVTSCELNYSTKAGNSFVVTYEISY